MKTAILLAALAGAAAGGTAALLVGSKATVDARAETQAIEPSAPIARESESDARFDALARELDTLRMDLATLRAAATREPAEEPASPAPEVAAISADPTPALRAAVLKVIDDDRKQRESDREAERQKREEEQLLARAERVAKKFNLGLDDQKKLADVYAGERARFEEMRTLAQNEGGMRADPGGMRDAFRSIRDWRTGELTRLFGAETGKQIDEFENERFRGGVGARRGGNGNGGNGNGGGAGGLQGLGYTSGG